MKAKLSLPCLVKSSELQLGDVVALKNHPEDRGAHDSCTVKQIKDGLITLFRPYTHTSDFSCTAGVICYVGVETFTVFQDSNNTWLLLSRNDRIDRPLETEKEDKQAKEIAHLTNLLKQITENAGTPCKDNLCIVDAKLISQAKVSINKPNNA